MISTSKLAPALAVLLLAAGGGGIATAQGQGRAAASGQPVVLLGGKSLEGWKPIGEPHMMLLPDGSIGAMRGNGVLYFADRAFADYTLELEFLPELPQAGAAVLLRIPQGATSSADSAEHGSYEVELGENPVPTGGEPLYYKRSAFITGAINSWGDSVHSRDQMSPHRSVLRPAGQWNTLRVEAAGQHYTVSVNGEKVTDFYGRKATEGYIGVVNHTPDVAVRFRNIRVMPRAAAKGPNSLAEQFAVHDQRAPIRILMVTATQGFRHVYGIAGAKEVMKDLERTTELRVDTTENLAMLNKDSLARYDVLFFANSTLRIAPKDTSKAALQEVRLQKPIPDAVTPAQQQVVIEFVRSGKGLVVAHAGLDAFYGWNDYKQMVGGGLFWAHPWVKHLRIVNEAKTHPATRHLGDDLWLREEFYILDTSPRATSRVLLSLDNSTLGTPNMGRLPEPQNTDHPVSWYRTYGQGRVFATILGHFRDTWNRPEFVQHLLTGIRMAAGRLDANGAPMGGRAATR
jgi:type 1 glutamine amidotransferase